MDGIENPVAGQEIRVIYWAAPDGVCPYFRVGTDGVTRIEMTAKPGMFADIPYVRVWAEGRAIGEFCQHQLRAVFFAPEEGI